MNLIKTQDWFTTQAGEPRGYIQPHALSELWFHVGTACNLSCPFCLEGSKPGDTRLEAMTLADVEPYLQPALDLGVKRFSFTGGEPFVIRGFVDILTAASALRPCLVLTNGTRALTQRLHQLQAVVGRDIQFRISLDYPDATRHEQGRGEGTFLESIAGIHALRKLGFEVSIARQMDRGEDSVAVTERYKNLFIEHDLPEDLHIVAFPDFLTPGSITKVPEITEHCMTHYHTESSRQDFMCAYSKMVVKQDSKMQIYACTLVDDDPHYCLGHDLNVAQQEKIILKHHRCYSCFAFGASCSG